MATSIHTENVDVKVRIDGVNVDRDDFTPPFHYGEMMYYSNYNCNYSVFIELGTNEMIKYLTQSGYIVSNPTFDIAFTSTMEDD